MRRSLVAVALACVVAVLAACEEESPSPSPTTKAGGSPAATAKAGKRVLSISASARQDPPPQVQDYINAFELGYKAGARGEFDSHTWQKLEPSAGHFALDEVKETFSFAKDRGLVVLLGIQVLNTTAKETPPDLAGVPFDSPQMKRRFHALIDALRPHLGKQLTYLSIGNEVDEYLGAHANEWGPYKNFYQDAVAYVHSVLPGVKLGVTTTFEGAKGGQAGRVADLNASSDVFILTYYPLGANFVVRGANAPVGDFPQMVQLAKGRPVVLQEVGYPAAGQLSSSEQAQADFVNNVYAAWKAAGGSIPFLNFFLLHDLPPKMCDELAQYYGVGGANFKAYLCSLGLRKVNGAPKAAWQAFSRGAGEVR